MSSLHLLTTNKLYTEKSDGLVSLFKKNITIPTTIIFQDEERIKAAIEIMNLEPSEYFYVRINFPGHIYPHHISSCSHKLDVENDLKSFIERAKSMNKYEYDIIIQPIFNFEWSGAALIKNNLILIEIVFGHPISLLRHGEFKYRFLFNKAKELLDVNEGNQKIYLRWEKNVLTTSDTILRKLSFDQILSQLRKIRDTEELLYEFGFSNPTFFYLESKSVNPNGFNSLKNNTIQKPFTVFSNGHQESLFKRSKFLSPKMEYLKDVIKEDEIVIEAGAYLSHLSTFCASQSITCQFLS